MAVDVPYRFKNEIGLLDWGEGSSESGTVGADMRGAVLMAVVVVVVAAELRGGDTVPGVAMGADVVPAEFVRMGVVGSKFVGSLTDFLAGGRGRGTVGGKLVMGVSTRTFEGESVLAVEVVIVVVEVARVVSAGEKPWFKGAGVGAERAVKGISRGVVEVFVEGGGGGPLVGGGGGALAFPEGTDKLESGVGLVTVRVGGGSGRVKSVLGEFCRDKDNVGGSVDGCKGSLPLGEGGADREPLEAKA